MMSPDGTAGPLLAGLCHDDPRLLRYQRTVAASHDGFWERNLRTQAAWYSPSFLKLFGFADGQVLARRGAATARVHPDDRGLLRAAYNEALRCNGAFDYELRFLDAAGLWRWVRGRGHVWADASGRPEFICGAVSAVPLRTPHLQQLAQQHLALEALVQERTAKLAAALALAEQRRLEAERANAAKSRFLAHMSHEIRTPLNGVLGLTELALRSATQPDQQRYLAVAQQSGQALLQVISDVLDFSRIEAGRADLRPQPVDLSQLLADALRAAMPLARQRDLRLGYDWTGDSRPVLGDASGLRQIVTNLLGNAIKFTPHGQVLLTADARPDGNAGLALRICVRDSGPGIPAALHSRVFEAFEQGDDSLARRHGGTGLGLAIARQLARAMGGELSLRSPAGGGAEFTLALCLPLAPLAPLAPLLPLLPPTPSARPLPNPPSAAAQRTPAAAPGGTPATLRQRVWLVYDRQAAGHWLARRMARLGWAPEVLPGLAAALWQARQPLALRPDLVLLAESVLVAGTDLAPLRAALPGTAMHLLIRPDWCAPALEQAAAALGIRPLLAPLTPAVLAQLRLPEEPGLSDKNGAPSPPDGPGVPSPPDGPGAPSPPDGPGGRLRPGATVLLVEDNAVNQLVGEAFLQALGLRVQLAASGSDALAACLRHPPALVLMDLQMPGMDGLETTARLLALQRDGRWPGSPILALTAHTSEADRAACLAAGMAAVLTKPLSLDRLRQQLAPWLSA